MGKKSHKTSDSKGSQSNTNGSIARPLVVQEEAVDPSLALLFASSAGPVIPPSRTRYEEPPPIPVKAALNTKSEDSIENETSEQGEDEDEELSSVDGDIDDTDLVGLSEDDAALRVSSDFSKLHESLDHDFSAKQTRKRKRQDAGDDLEGKYMLKLAQEEEKEEAERKAERKAKRQRSKAAPDESSIESTVALGEDGEDLAGSQSDERETRLSNGEVLDVPLHETLAPDKNASELEKSSRTVFLANVSTSAITDKHAKKVLIDHMGSFLESLAPPKDGNSTHKVESIRFRSTAYEAALPKKAAFATKALMGATTKSTNAYVVYSTAFAAREAVKRLNGSTVLDRHLRVDGVAHPSKIDHRRCVFVGNLGFVDDESMMDDGGENDRKRSKIPSDIEEGLWRQFGKAGGVESVRVVRDEKTRVGKGFAYVQFKDGNSVEAALLFNEKKYPPMLPRILRVTRAKAVKKTALASQRARTTQKVQPGGSSNPNNAPIYNPKMSAQQQSLQGRASKLLGRAGAAQFSKYDRNEPKNSKPKPGLEEIAKTPESIVFEGFRASSKAGKPKDLKFGKGGGKKQGKPKTRSSKRGADWKKTGGRNAK